MTNNVRKVAHNCWRIEGKIVKIWRTATSRTLSGLRGCLNFLLPKRLCKRIQINAFIVVKTIFIKANDVRIVLINLKKVDKYKIKK
jgi:hypothetical protein